MSIRQEGPADWSGYFFETLFEDKAFGRSLLASVPCAGSRRGATRVEPSRRADNRWELPEPMASVRLLDVLTHEQQSLCFRQMNYLKYRLSLRRSRLLENRLTSVRNALIESNLRLVISIAKKYAAPSSDLFDEMVCVGNETLVRAVDRFDYRRGVSFSTYAFRAIQNSLYSVLRKESRLNQKMILDGNESADAASTNPDQQPGDETQRQENREQVKQFMTQLPDRDRRIVMARFGLGRQGKALAFHAIAKEVGLSTTRTIQRFHFSIQKMRGLFGGVLLQ